jgi:Tfp pilus assembly protein PilV
MLVAVMIIMVSMLALLTSMVTTIRTNTNTDRRNNAIRVSNQTGEALLALPFTNNFTDQQLTSGNHPRVLDDSDQNKKGFPNTVQYLKNYHDTYDISWNVDPTKAADTLEISITVAYPNREYQNDPDHSHYYKVNSVVYKRRDKTL